MHKRTKKKDFNYLPPHPRVLISSSTIVNSRVKNRNCMDRKELGRLFIDSATEWWRTKREKVKEDRRLT